MKIKYLAIILFLILSGFTSKSQVKEDEKIGIYENLNGFIPDDLVFLDIDSNKVNLKELINKPTVLALVYYTCPGICSPLLDGVAEVISKTDMILGKDYQVLTVSFNDSETPYLAKKKRNNYLHQLTKKVDEKGWMFYTGDSTNITKLTRTVGFRFKREGKDFIHAATIIVISPEGKITRYLYGISFLPFDLKLALIEASKGQAQPTINKVLKYCFSYDAAGKKYVFSITRVSAAIILLGAFVFFLFLVIKRKSQNKSNINV